MDNKKYIIRKVKELANEWHNNLDDEVFLEIEVYLDTVVFPEMSGVEIAEIAEDEDSIYYLAQEVDEIIDFENLIEQTINENIDDEHENSWMTKEYQDELDREHEDDEHENSWMTKEYQDELDREHEDEKMYDKKYTMQKDIATEILELIEVYYGDMDYGEMDRVEQYIIFYFLDDLTIEELNELDADLEGLLEIAAYVVEDAGIKFYDYSLPINEQTLNERLINTNEFINGVNNSSKDYYEKTIRFFGGGGVIITLTSLRDLYVTDIDTNETVLFATLETSPANNYDWGWELRDKLLDLEMILERSNWRKELGLKDSVNEQTINENEREPGREHFEDLIDEMIEANWGPSVDGYWRNKIKNDSIRELRKEKLKLDIDGKGKAYVDTTRNEVNDYLEVIADVVLKVKDKYDSIPKVNRTKKSWRAADERKAGLRENMNETFYLIISTLWNEWFGVTNGNLDYYAVDGLEYADYAKEEVINHFIRLNRVPTEDEVIDFYINHEADLNQVITRNREIFDNLLDEADINLIEENELEVISFNREELVEYLKSYGLDAFIEDVVEEVARQLDENEDETHIGPDMDKLLGFEEGWIVGISAAKGEDLDIDNYNNHSLAEELTKLGLDFIGPNISMWDGIAEEGFLVNVHSDLNLERLYDLGNKYNQDWVAVWEAPLELGKTIIQVDFKENHTMLDGKAYSIVSDDISGYEATNLNEQTINENILTEEAKMKLRDLVVEIEAYGQFYLEEDDWTIENVINEIERMGLYVAAYVDREPVRTHVEAILYIRGEVEKLLEFFDRYAPNLYNENTVSILADADVIG